MFKFLVFAVVLQQAVCEIFNPVNINANDQKSSTLPSNDVSRDIHPKLTGLYGPNEFHAANQTFIFQSASPWQNFFRWNGNFGANVGSDYLVTYGMGAHKLHVRKLTWNIARRICAEEGGHLAVIRTDSEEKIIAQMMHENLIDDAWLGYHDMFEEGDWVTVLDEPLGTTGWARWSKKFSPNPDNFQGKQHCARYVRDKDGMDDETCSLLKSFICKIAPK